jgi:AraC-like DNA-binding protein
MLYHIAKPSFPLSKFIKHYWTLENCIPSGEEHIQRIVPSGLLELIFYFDEKPVSTAANHSINESTLITGQLNGYYDLKITGRISLFSIIFQPHGLSAFLDVPLQDLYNQNLPFKLVFKNDANEIEGKLFEAKSFAERITIVEEYFFKLLKYNELKYIFKRIHNSIFKINQAKGLVDINELASEACYSRKQFERNFSTMVGTSPKQFLKIIRFQHAIERKSLDRNLSLTALTYQCGYYDQAHMINDFQQLAGMTPREYFSGCEPYSDYFQ